MISSRIGWRAKKVPAVLAAAAIAGATLVAAQAGVASGAPAANLPPFQGQIRTSVNYQLNTDPNVVRGKDAPGLAVDPGNPKHIVEVQLDLINFECQYNVSFDGGTTWKGGNLKAPPAYPQTSPCTVLGHGASAMDAGVTFGSGQNVYVAWASAIGQGSTAALLSKSTDGGQTFAAAVEATPGDPSPTGDDHEYPKVAVLPGAGTGGADKVVVVSDSTTSTGDHSISGTVLASVSNDSGATWTGPIRVNPPFDASTNPYGAIEHTQPVFAPDGSLYVGWRTAQPGDVPNTDPKFPNGFLQVAKSTDGGLTWGGPITVTNVRGFVYNGPAVPPYGALVKQYCCSSFPRLAVDPTSGNLYMVWSQDAHLYAPSADVAAQDHFQIQRSQVWFIRSTDSGATWNGRKQISEDPGANSTVNPSLQTNPETQTRHPNVSVAPDGRVDVVWQDRRHSYRACSQTHVACDEARLGDTYYSYSLDQGGSFSPNRRITDRHMNNDVGFDYRFSTYWNFGPVAASIGSGKLLFAWQDSRLGNFDTDTQDIFLAKTDLSVPVAARPTVSNFGSHPAPIMSVAYSQKANPGGSEAELAGTFASRAVTKVVIANQSDVANILAGAVLARANLGPMLVSPSTGLPAVVKTEVTRMSPIGAYILGNLAQTSPQIQADLVAAGVPSAQIVRIGGTGPADMAAKIAMAMDHRSPTDVTAMVPAFDAVVIANPASPDAVAASNLAAARRLPFLYVDQNAIPSQTSAALAALNINKVLVVGGSGAVSDAVLTQLAPYNPTRLGGADQYATSQAVVTESIARGLPTNQVFVADGAKPIHGALLGAPSARIGGLLVLTHGVDPYDAELRVRSAGLVPRPDRYFTSVIP